MEVAWLKITLFTSGCVLQWLLVMRDLFCKLPQVLLKRTMLLNSVFLIACSKVKLSKSWFVFSVSDFGFHRCYWPRPWSFSVAIILNVIQSSNYWCFIKPLSICVSFPRLFCRQITVARVKYFRKKLKQDQEVHLVNHLFSLPSRIPGVTIQV